MKIRVFLAIFAALLFVAAIPPAGAAADTKPGRRVLVMLQLGPEHYRAGADYGGGGYGDAMGEASRLRTARRIAREHRLVLVDAWPMQIIGVDCVVMEISDARAAEQVVAELEKVPGVAWSQPYNEFRMQARSASTTPGYNDRLFPAQPVAAGWGLARLHRLATGRGVTVAIVDSRIDARHPDLAGQIALSPDFTGNHDTGAEQHGTGVAGIIAAHPNNAMGIAGVAPGARVLGLRACWERPHGGSTVCDTLSLAKAITFAIENNADVINLSLTGPRDRLVRTLIDVALRKGATVVAAIDPQAPMQSFPALVPGVVAVADERLSVGASKVYIAPGQDVPTTEPEGKWSIVSGSSFAAAHVSGLVALLRQLAGPSARRTPPSALIGAAGTVDACAAVARLAQVDRSACEVGR